MKPFPSVLFFVLNIIKKYKFHPSIKLIKSKNKGLSSSFSFKFATINEVKKSINNLDPKKASQKEDICTSILKANADFFASYVCNDINASISSSTFPNQLKEADIIPAHKKKSKLSKENYRPISILPNISKYMKGVFMTNCQFILTIYSRSYNVVSGKVIATNNVC